MKTQHSLRYPLYLVLLIFVASFTWGDTLIYSTYDGTNAPNGAEGASFWSGASQYVGAGDFYLARAWRVTHIRLNVGVDFGSSTDFLYHLSGIGSDIEVVPAVQFSTAGNHEFIPSGSDILHRGVNYQFYIEPRIVPYNTALAWYMTTNFATGSGWGDYRQWFPFGVSGSPAIQVYGRPLFVSPSAIFDGDDIYDRTVYWPEGGNWYVQESETGAYLGGGPQNWGWKDALPVPGDYDGDGKTDLAVYHPAAGNWYILKSSTGLLRQRQWGWSEALPTDNQLRINRAFGFK